MCHFIVQRIAVVWKRSGW